MTRVTLLPPDVVIVEVLFGWLAPPVCAVDCLLGALLLGDDARVLRVKGLSPPDAGGWGKGRDDPCAIVVLPRFMGELVEFKTVLRVVDAATLTPVMNSWRRAS